jgi:hypothetical protein
VGSHRGLVTDLWERRRPYCDVIQTEWSVADDELDFPGAFLITHRSIAPGINSIREHMATDSRGKDPRIAELGRDRGLLAQVMLRAAVLQRPEGIVLFSSKRKDHVASSVRAANDPSLDELAIALRSSVRRSVLRSSPRQA